MEINDYYLLYWFMETVQLLQRFCTVAVVVLIAVRWEWLRTLLRCNSSKKRYSILAVLVYGLLAILGTHSGIRVDIAQGKHSYDFFVALPIKLSPTQAIVGFRDTITMVAGLIGGPWLGIGTGLIAGLERNFLGGLAGFASGSATLLLGLLAGLLSHLKPDWTRANVNVILIVFVCTLVQRLIILYQVKPFDQAQLLSIEVFVPVLIINTFGCLLLLWIIRDKNDDELVKEAQAARLLQTQAELRAFRAQSNPHFLKNALGNINGLIRINQDKASESVIMLSDLFAAALKFSSQETITLAEEISQIDRYISLKQLSLGNKLHVKFSIPPALHSTKIAPYSLLTLVENAFDHGLVGFPPPYQLTVKAETDNDQLVLKVEDNGGGIPPSLIAQLGNKPVYSKNKGGGVALYQLMQSLHLLFDEGVSLNFDRPAEGGTVAILKHPKLE